MPTRGHETRETPTEVQAQGERRVRVARGLQALDLEQVLALDRED